MDARRVQTARSFIILLYDHAMKERGKFNVPLSVAAPFANRLVREALAGRADALREPWYILIPHGSKDAALRRTPMPVGPTSIHGEQYVPETEPAPRVTLHPQARIRHFTVRLLEYQHTLYEGHYSVDDIFQAWAELLARRLVERGRMRLDEGPFYYAVDDSAQAVGSISSDLFPAEAYEVEGVFKLPALARDRERTVFIRVRDAPLAVREVESDARLGTPEGAGVEGSGVVLMRAEVYRGLQREIELSAKVENGGYLLGRAFRQPSSPESEDEAGFRWLLEITDVVLAEAAWGKRGSLLFTGETWSRVARLREREHPDKKLVGWFHTHLFKESEDFGLSGLDHDLHRRFLTKPWQVAVLVNIDPQSMNRTVRCYQRGTEGDLIESPFWVTGPASREGVEHE
ncbi:MAG TPA: hypothetical protein VF553_01510 [Pyrinomonadaceae bacterium]|jgi:hypothetical protein